MHRIAAMILPLVLLSSVDAPPSIPPAVRMVAAEPSVRGPQDAKVPTWAKAKDGAAVEPNSGWVREVFDVTTGMAMVLVPAGAYERGAADDDALAAQNEKPRHRVMLTKPFYLGKYEVTNAEFRRFAPLHDSGTAYGAGLNDDRQPVVGVTWQQARSFSERFGFRLPTEAEWEYAARAGATTPYPWGLDPNGAAKHANVADAAARREHDDWRGFACDDGHIVAAPVGTFAANAFGIHDMIGNVWEWCADAYGVDAYDSFAEVVVDPPASTRGRFGTLRGGCWRFGPSLCRVSTRYTDLHSYHHIGFRVARDPR